MQQTHTARTVVGIGGEDLASSELLAIRSCAWAVQALAERIASTQEPQPEPDIWLAVSQLNASIEAISADALVGGNVSSRSAQVSRAFSLAKTTVDRFGAEPATVATLDPTDRQVLAGLVHRNPITD
jgi:hypothetical protein